MSYILDALRKSERERPPGPVPDLFTLHGPQAPEPRKPKRALVVGALLLVVLAVGLWAGIGTDRRDEVDSRPPVAVSSQPRAQAPAAPATPRSAVAPALPAPARAVAAARRQVDERSPVPPPPAQKSRREAPSAAVPKAVSAGSSASPAPAPVSLSEPGAPNFIPPPPPDMIPPPPAGAAALTAPAPMGEMPSASIPGATVAAPAPAPVPEEAPPADGRVLNLTELPASIRAQLPKLVVSGHVWSEDPALRLLSVDDLLLHEGGTAAPGVSLQEITPTGAVFVYKGWHFRLAGGRQ